MFFDARRRIALILLDADEGVRPTLKRIRTECGITLSPAAPAEVIVYAPDGAKVVFEAAHGVLPDGTVVVGVCNRSGAFPETDPRLRVKLILDPYQAADEPEVIEPKLVAWLGGCPICGTLTDDDFDDAFDDEGDDSDDGDDGDDSDDGDGSDDGDDDEVVEIPMPRRFTLEMLAPSVN